MFRYLLILLFSLGLSLADDFSQQRLLWQYVAGKPGSIEDFCLKQARKTLDWNKLDEARLAQCLEDKDLFQACYAAHFFSELRKSKVATVADLADKEFSKWLLEHPEVWEKLVFSERINKETLPRLHQIWLLENKELHEPVLNLALGAALMGAEDDFAACMDKYLFYKSSLKEDKLFPQFQTLDAWEMAVLLSGREEAEELRWGQEYLASRKNFTVKNAANAACSLIPYRDKNKQGISVHKGAAFYDNKPISLEIYVEYGGVCGAVSKAACGFLKSKGIPAYAIGQPGHCAFVWKDEKGDWRIGNNISGWSRSTGGNKGPWSGPVTRLYSLSRFQTGENAAASKLCYYLSSITQKQENRAFLLEQAVKKNPGNLLAWHSLVELKSSKAKDEEKLLMVKHLKKELGEDAHALKEMVELLIPEKNKKRYGYAYAALLLTEKESKDSLDYFMREFWPSAMSEISTLKKDGLQYHEKNRNIFFHAWVELYTKKPASQGTRMQTCAVMEKIVPALSESPETCGQFLTAYHQFLKKWQDGKLITHAISWQESLLEETRQLGAKKKLLFFGMQLATLVGNEKSIRKYSEELKSLDKTNFPQ